MRNTKRINFLLVLLLLSMSYLLLYFYNNKYEKHEPKEFNVRSDVELKFPQLIKIIKNYKNQYDSLNKNAILLNVIDTSFDTTKIEITQIKKKDLNTRYNGFYVHYFEYYIFENDTIYFQTPIRKILELKNKRNVKLNIDQIFEPKVWEVEIVNDSLIINTNPRFKSNYFRFLPPEPKL